MSSRYAAVMPGSIPNYGLPLEASEFVATLERRRGLKNLFPGEVTLRSRYISADGIEPWMKKMGKSSCAEYVRRVARSL
jgi:hypothetical protein